MTSIDELLSEITARESTARVLLRQDLIARHAELDAELQAALQRDQRLGGGLDAEAPAIARHVLEFEAEIEDSKRAFKFVSLGKRRWQNLLALHPPTRDQLKVRAGLDHNPETFPIAAIAASCTDPVMSVDQVATLADHLSVAQFDTLWAHCLDANVGGADSPKSLVAGGIARANAVLASSAPA